MLRLCRREVLKLPVHGRCVDFARDRHFEIVNTAKSLAKPIASNGDWSLLRGGRNEKL